jgi:hypothetical protein
MSWVPQLRLALGCQGFEMDIRFRSPVEEPKYTRPLGWHHHRAILGRGHMPAYRRSIIPGWSCKVGPRRRGKPSGPPLHGGNGNDYVGSKHLYTRTVVNILNFKGFIQTHVPKVTPSPYCTCDRGETMGGNRTDRKQVWWKKSIS